MASPGRMACVARYETRTRRGRLSASRSPNRSTRTISRAPPSRSSSPSTRPTSGAMVTRVSTGPATEATHQTPAAKPRKTAARPSISASATGRARSSGVTERQNPAAISGAAREGSPSVAVKKTRMPAPKATASQGNSRRCSASRATLLLKPSRAACQSCAGAGRRPARRAGTAPRIALPPPSAMCPAYAPPRSKTCNARAMGNHDEFLTHRLARATRPPRPAAAVRAPSRTF